ncbi:MAG: DUF106 domain-containing protein [Candidatus Lokiarchaeota archaeon]|nr:DUF106 domain-containing protein [Candidatus Lokiarchaeota archaeon]
MSDAFIIIQIMLITIVMVFLGMILNKLLGLSKDKVSEFKEQAFNLQERMKNAQVLADPQLMLQVQRETMQFTKSIMIKQFVPLCLRCFIFIGIFAVLGFIYADYDSGLLPFPLLIFGTGWVAIYFIFSISFSLIIFGMKKLYKRITGKQVSSQGHLREIMELVSPTQQSSGISFQVANPVPFNTDEDSSEKSDSWKDRIQK